MDPDGRGADVDAAAAYCYLTTTGRTSGEPRTIEIWFGSRGRSLYLLAGGGEAAHWVRNIRRDPRVRVRVEDQAFDATARILGPGEEDGAARRLLLEKYAAGYTGDLTSWGREALAVAIDLE